MANDLLPGKFVWFEHTSSDPTKVKEFYKAVFGWGVQSPPDMKDYEMITNGEGAIGGYFKMNGVPPHWISYVSVPDVDKATAIATEKGAQTIVPPTDIPQVGRFSRVADPQGAHVCLFTSSMGDPPDVEDIAVGGFVWNELHVAKPDDIGAFYEAVVGWAVRGIPMGEYTYFIVNESGHDRGGMAGLMPGGGDHPHWLPYVRTANTDETVGKVEKAGGKILGPAFDIPGVGRIAIAADPAGAVFAVLDPKPDSAGPRTN